VSSTDIFIVILRFANEYIIVKYDIDYLMRWRLDGVDVELQIPSNNSFEMPDLRMFLLRNQDKLYHRCYWEIIRRRIYHKLPKDNMILLEPETFDYCLDCFRIDIIRCCKGTIKLIRFESLLKKNKS